MTSDNGIAATHNTGSRYVVPSQAGSLRQRMLCDIIPALDGSQRALTQIGTLLAALYDSRRLRATMRCSGAQWPGQLHSRYLQMFRPTRYPAANPGNFEGCQKQLGHKQSSEATRNLKDNNSSTGAIANLALVIPEDGEASQRHLYQYVQLQVFWILVDGKAEYQVDAVVTLPWSPFPIPVLPGQVNVSGTGRSKHGMSRRIDHHWLSS